MKVMDEDGEEQGLPDMNELKMKIFEMENPEGARKLKQKVEKKMFEIKEIVEKEVDGFFEQKERSRPPRSYIG